MRWMTRQFSLPILLGISLTSVSIAILYVLYKKDEEDIKSRKNHVEISKRFTAECKVPRQFVPAVIGRGGSMIKDIQNKTGTQIHFKEDNIDCPDRICIIKGSYEGVHLAEEMIKSVIQNQPIIETYEMYVPQKACGRIIGRGGEVIHQIQATSSAKIIIESSYTPYDPNAERRIIIKGTAEQIATALLQIEDKVREEKEARTKLEASSASRLPRGKLSPRNTKNNIQSEQVQTTELLPVSDGGMEVYISAMETPSQFWVQVVGPGTTALDKLVSDMTVYYNDEKNHELHKLRNITLGQIVAAKFSFNEQWYRAEVISAPEDGQCEVYFVDYGDREMVQLDCILELRTDFLSLRLQAIECSLANIKPRDNEWSVDACNLFAEFTCVAEWIVLTAKVRGYKERSFGYGRSRREGSPIPCVDLFCDTTVNVGQELINEGFADLEENLSSTASSTLSLSNRSHEVTAISTPTSTSPLAKRALSPEMLTDTPNKLDSISELQNTSIIDLKITSNVHGLSQIEEIDLVTPQKPSTRIEEIDLVTPVKDETKHFIENEKKVQHEDGRGDYLRNGNSNQYGRSCNSQMKVAKYSPVAPAGYESDISDDSGEMELGSPIFRSSLSTGKSRADNQKKEGTKPPAYGNNGNTADKRRRRRTRKERYRKLLQWNNSNISSLVRCLRCFGRTSLHSHSNGWDRRDRAESSGTTHTEDCPSNRGLHTHTSS